MGKFIPLSVPNLKGNELKYVTKAIKTEWVSTGGMFIADFEREIAKYVKAGGAVACQSGTAGLHLGLLVCGIRPEDEVLVPTLTFIAAVNPVRYIGATPVFMDCDSTLTLDPQKLAAFCEDECLFDGENLINKLTGKRIKALVVVHVFGNIADMKSIIEIAKKYNLRVIEDATEALGTYITEGIYSDCYAGTIGDIGVFSFNGNKIITTGGGGMIVSNDPEKLQRARYLSTQAKDDEVYFVHEEIGYNYRMTNVQAAIGLGQLEQLETFIKIKKANYESYLELGIKLLPFREGTRPNYWLYSVMTADRKKMIDALAGKNIQARPVWTLIHTLKPYVGFQSYKIEQASYYQEQLVNIPCSSNLTREDVEYVAKAFKSIEQNT